MQENELTAQLDRLIVFGAFKQEWLPEYSRILLGRDCRFMRRAVDRLIEQYDGARFPRPKVILEAIRQVAPQYDTPAVEDATYRDAETTAAWAVCFRLCWYIKDSTKRRHEFAHLTLAEYFEDRPENKQRVLEHYQQKKGDLTAYLTEAGVGAASLKSACDGSTETLVPSLEDNKLPF